MPMPNGQDIDPFILDMGQQIIDDITWEDHARYSIGRRPEEFDLPASYTGGQ